MGNETKRPSQSSQKFFYNIIIQYFSSLRVKNSESFCQDQNRGFKQCSQEVKLLPSLSSPLVIPSSSSIGREVQVVRQQKGFDKRGRRGMEKRAEQDDHPVGATLRPAAHSLHPDIRKSSSSCRPKHRRFSCRKSSINLLFPDLIIRLILLMISRRKLSTHSSKMMPVMIHMIMRSLFVSGQNCFGGIETFEKVSMTDFDESFSPAGILLQQTDTALTRDCINLCKQQPSCL